MTNIIKPENRSAAEVTAKKSASRKGKETIKEQNDDMSGGLLNCLTNTGYRICWSN